MQTQNTAFISKFRISYHIFPRECRIDLRIHKRCQRIGRDLCIDTCVFVWLVRLKIPCPRRGLERVIYLLRTVIWRNRKPCLHAHRVRERLVSKKHKNAHQHSIPFRTSRSRFPYHVKSAVSASALNPPAFAFLITSWTSPRSFHT